MRKLIVTENITLDGVIDARDGWFAPAGDEELDQSDWERSTVLSGDLEDNVRSSNASRAKTSS